MVYREKCRNVEGVSFFDGSRKDDYVLFRGLNLLAQQGEPLPEGFQPSVAIYPEPYSCFRTFFI